MPFNILPCNNVYKTAHEHNMSIKFNLSLPFKAVYNNMNVNKMDINIISQFVCGPISS